jgi:hypothetical protein
MILYCFLQVLHMSAMFFFWLSLHFAVHSFITSLSSLGADSGGRDLSGNKRTNKQQSFDQKFEKLNEALRVSCHKGYPVRVVR